MQPKLYLVRPLEKRKVGRPAHDAPVVEVAEDRSVVIVCATCDNPTRHRFVGRRRWGAAIIAYELIYACDECKAERRYGLVQEGGID